MDETLIHCVDDIEAEETDIVLEINFPGEETVYAGINMRPYIIECLHEANKHFQVVVLQQVIKSMPMQFLTTLIQTRNSFSTAFTDKIAFKPPVATT